jgi:hypothetical protein
VFRELPRGRTTIFVPRQKDGTLPRLIVPIRMGGELLGSMWAVVDRPVFKAPDVASLKQRGDVPELIKALRYTWYLEIGTLAGIVRRADFQIPLVAQGFDQLRKN